MDCSGSIVVGLGVVMLAEAATGQGNQVAPGRAPATAVSWNQGVPADQPRADVWVPSTPVRTMTLAGDLLYLGNVRWIGPHTGSFGVVSPITGDLESTWPKFDGEVFAIEPDGVGGWFVAGDFGCVGAEPRRSLAHVLADGTLVTAFPEVEGRVRAMDVSGGSLYVVGKFGEVGGQSRLNLAEIDVASGAVTAWDPTLGENWGSSEEVFDVLVDGATVFVGGFFDDGIGWADRRNFAALDASTGVALPLDPDPNGSVQALELWSGELIVGGNFDVFGGLSRSKLASVDPVSGIVGTLSVPANSTVLSLARSRDTLYVGGLFTTLGFQPRSRLGAVDLETGTLLPWTANVAGGDGSSTAVHELVFDGGRVFAAGQFESIGGVPRNDFVALDAVDASVQPWESDAAGPESPEGFALATSAGRIALGGEFLILGGEARGGVAALDLTTGRPTPWAPAIDPVQPGSSSNVQAILPTTGRVYLGGEFGFVNGVPIEQVAAVDDVTGATDLGFDASLAPTSFSVDAMALRQDVLYLGGDFPNPNGFGSGLAAVDASTGALVPGFLGDVDNDVTRMDFSDVDARLYVAGNFDQIGIFAEPRMGLAKLEPLDGFVGSFDALLDGGVDDFVEHGSRLYLGGTFLHAAGIPRRGIALVDPLTGVVCPWNAGLEVIGPGLRVRALARAGTTLYLGGRFDSAHGQLFRGLVAVHADAPVALDWRPDPDGEVWELDTTPDAVLVGGDFERIAGQLLAHLAIFDRIN